MDDFIQLERVGRKGNLSAKITTERVADGLITILRGTNLSTKSGRTVTTSAIQEGETPDEAVVRVIEDLQRELYEVRVMSERFRSFCLVMDVASPSTALPQLTSILSAFDPGVVERIHATESSQVVVQGIRFNIAIIAGDVESITASFWSCSMTPLQAALIVALNRLNLQFLDQLSTPVDPMPALKSKARMADLPEDLEKRLSVLGIVVRPVRLKVDHRSPMAILAGI